MMLTIRYRIPGKRSANGPAPYYIDGGGRQPVLQSTAEPDKGFVS